MGEVAKFGVGITTRNRSRLFRRTLEGFAEHHTNESIYVIVDDDSDDILSVADAVNWFRSQVDARVVLRASSQRMGIARAKNACLAVLAECDHIFLFDDDIWPTVDGWSEKWASASESSGVEHSMYMNSALTSEGRATHGASALYKVKTTLGDMEGWTNCLGVALHFTKNAIQVVGGYDTQSAKNVYGYEHAQMSKRCCESDLTKGLRYPSPKGISDWFYSVDINHNWRGEKLEDSPWLSEVHSSVTPEEASRVEENSAMMRSKQLHVPLVDPLAVDVSAVEEVATIDAIIPCKVNFDGLKSLVETLDKDPQVGQIVVIADGEKAKQQIEKIIDTQITLLSVTESIGLHVMWNKGIDEVLPNDRHVAIINDDVTISADGMGIAADLLDRRPDIGLVSPCNDVQVTEEFVQTTGFAGFCMVVAKDLIKEWKFDERMMWWYGDNDIITWVDRAKNRKTGWTGLTHALGNESKTIRTSPPRNFHADIKRDAEIYKEKWES